MRQKSIRTPIRRLYVPNAIYFITTNTHRQRPIFADDRWVALLRETMRSVKNEYHPFKLHAYVFLPDHLHLLLRVPPDGNISTIVHSVKRNFTVTYKDARGIKRSVKLWQKGFWDHVVRDEEDYLQHFHYIHYNPVKHGYVALPGDYPHSSFHYYVQKGWYDGLWGSSKPMVLRGLDYG